MKQNKETSEYKCLSCKYYSDCNYAMTSKAKTCQHFDPKINKQIKKD